MFTSPMDSFSKDGFVKIEGFYDLQEEVEPIRMGIRWIIERLCKKHGVSAPTGTPDEAMCQGYLALARANRTWAGEVYDAVKQLPAFMSLVASRKNIELFEELRPRSVAGVAGGGFGIRIDAPSEDRFRTYWHQEFPAQLRSTDGIVFWSPLLPVTLDMGPVELCVGSQRDGIAPVYEDQSEGKEGAYALRLDREEERVRNFPKTAPLTQMGDLLVLDFLTLHQSGVNRSDRPRWSMQFRYFNYADPLGVKISWKGSFAAGLRYSDLIPELEA